MTLNHLRRPRANHVALRRPGGNTFQAELGGDFLDRLEPERKTRYLRKRVQALGHRVYTPALQRVRRRFSGEALSLSGQRIEKDK